MHTHLAQTLYVLEFNLTIANMIETVESTLATMVETAGSALAIMGYLAHST